MPACLLTTWSRGLPEKVPGFQLLEKFTAVYKIGRFLTKYHSGDEVKKTEMGRTCGTYGGEERCIQGFSGET
jgi:hypothetical protein